MSVEAMATVLHHSRATGTAKVVIIGIANHAGDGGSWPSIASLAKYARVDERSVQRAIRKLEELGEVRVHDQAGGTRSTQDRYRPNRYDILVACPPDCDRSVAHRCTDDGPDEEPGGAAAATPDNGPDRGDGGVTPHADTGVTPTSPLALVRGDAGVAQGVTPASPEPSLNHPDTPQPPASGGPTPSIPNNDPACGRHPAGDGKNCRACGTTSKQLAEQRRAAAEAASRAAEQKRLAAERAERERIRAAGRSARVDQLVEQTRARLAGAR